MKLQIEIPSLEDIVTKGCRVPLAPGGQQWKSKCLGQAGKGKGVYVIHHNGELQYIGKTNGPSMSFSTRLRREFQEKASGGKHIYPKLASLITPPDVMVTLFPAEQIETLVRVEGCKIGRWQMIEIFETAMIQVLFPKWQSHEVNHIAHFMLRHFPEATRHWMKADAS
jgi:hypothetical protein